MLTCTNALRSLRVWTLDSSVFCFILLGMVSVLLRSGRWERDYLLSSTFVSMLNFHFYLHFFHSRKLLPSTIAEKKNTISSRKKIYKMYS